MHALMSHDLHSHITHLVDLQTGPHTCTHMHALMSHDLRSHMANLAIQSSCSHRLW